MIIDHSVRYATRALGILLLTPLLLARCQQATDAPTIVHHRLRLDLDEQMHSRLGTTEETSAPLTGGFQPTEYLITRQGTYRNFTLASNEQVPIEDSKLGSGLRTVVQGHSNEKTLPALAKILTVEQYDQFPDLLIFQVAYVNRSTEALDATTWVNHAYTLQGEDEAPTFWSFQSGTYESRPDWVLPLTPDFHQDNYMGMNASDYGGGTPVTDVWRRDIGVAVGHIAPVPKLVSLPVVTDATGQQATVGVQYELPQQLSPGDTLATLKTFVSVHSGDYYAALKQYSALMQQNGLAFVPAEEAAYEPIWCAWGYERDFTLQEVINTLPKVKELGIRWAVLDDGFQQAEGDWDVNRTKFPRGTADMKRLVEAIHAQGLKAKLWWAPLAVDSGTQLLEEHPDVLLINAEGKPQDISWWDSYYMSPAAAATVEHTQSVIKMFMNDWGFDGLKMDGQHMNAAPPDYNPAHALEDPLQAVEAVPAFFEMIYKTARSIKPHAVVENCPCGTACSFYNMAYMNQSVSSDPTSSWQVRLKGKTFKALMGKTAYYGDHVELSDEGSDFASSFGVGAVLGTKFTWPKDNPTQSESFLLTPEKEKIWKAWFDLYNQKMLSKADYRGELYDIGFDKPETHAIQKGDTLHYAFYADTWDGELALRGLEQRTYRIVDYVNGQDYGTVEGPQAKLPVRFEKHLLLEAIPQ